MKNSFFILLLISSILSCNQSIDKGSRVAYLPYYDDATFTPHWFSPNDDSLENFHKIRSFSLTNQNGERMTNENFDGKIYVTDFFFTTCSGICPKMTSNLMMVQDAFHKDEEVLILSHSVTPEADSVAVLKEYSVANGMDPNKWFLVTGTQKEIYNLGRQYYFVEEDLGIDKEEDEFLHTENFVLIDKNRHIRGIYNGLNKTSVRQLIADIDALKKE